MANAHEFIQSILTGIQRLQRQYPDGEMPDPIARGIAEIDTELWNLVDIADDPKLLADLEGEQDDTNDECLW